MKKDTTLINIYLAIHNKRPITLDDLRYLAEYAPDCFEKTCENVIYNIPETKPVLAPGPPKPPGTDFNPPPPDLENIAKVLANIKRLEAKIVEGPYIHHCVGIHKDVVPVLYEACKYIGIKPDLYDPIEEEVKAYLRGE